MDFVINILLVFIILIILYNFLSISISNTPNNGMCSNNNTYKIYNGQNQNITQPLPILSKSKNTISSSPINNNYNQFFYK